MDRSLQELAKRACALLRDETEMPVVVVRFARGAKPLVMVTLGGAQDAGGDLLAPQREALAAAEAALREARLALDAPAP